MTLKVAAKLELVTWILGWGEKVEVLDPKELRAEVARIAKKTAGIYMKHRAS
jgi:predicted DNA-binding transcriptional regulator YafY